MPLGLWFEGWESYMLASAMWRRRIQAVFSRWAHGQKVHGKKWAPFMGLWTSFLFGNLMQSRRRAAGKARMGFVENILSGNRRVQSSGKKAENWFLRILFKVIPLMLGLHAAPSVQQEPSHRHIDRPYIRSSSSSTAPTTRGRLSTLVCWLVLASMPPSCF